MPFLKEFIINPTTKIKLWKLNLGELDYCELDEYDNNLIKAKKNQLVKEQFLAVRKITGISDVAEDFFSASQTWYPSISGIIISNKIKSGRGEVAAISRPFFPLVAALTL